LTFIESNEEISSRVGEVTGYGFFIQGSVSNTSTGRLARYNFRVIGERRSASIVIVLEHDLVNDWVVVDYRLNR